MFNEKEKMALEKLKEGDMAGFVSLFTDDMRKNYEFALQTIMINGFALGCFSDDIKNDEIAVLLAVKNEGRAIYYASENLNSNYDIAMEAVKQNPMALEFVSDDLKDHVNIVKEAVKRNAEAFKYASKGMKSSKPRIYSILSKDTIDILNYVDESLRSDPKFMIKIIETYPEAYKYCIGDSSELSIKVKEAKKVIQHSKLLEILKNDNIASFSEQLTEEEKNDYELASKAVRINGLALGCFSDNIRNKGTIVEAAVRSNGRALYYASEEFKNYHTICEDAIENDPSAFEFVGDELKTSQPFIYDLAKINIDVLQYVDESFRSNAGFMYGIVSNNKLAYKYCVGDALTDKIILKLVGKNKEENENFEDESHDEKNALLNEYRTILNRILKTKEEIDELDEKLRVANKRMNDDFDKCIELMNKFDNLDAPRK